MPRKKHILLVEDDVSMGFLLKDSLEHYDYEITHVSDGQLALKAFKSVQFDLCLLDVMMPIMDGFSLAEEIRVSDPEIPIIFLTAKSMKEDRIKGFNLGADDYVTKPFVLEELALRIRAVLSRGRLLPKKPESLSFSSYHLDIDNIMLHNGEKHIQLTQKEADILALFVSHQNTLLKRAYILKVIWEDEGYFVGRSLDVFISKLRKHFKDDPSISIVNVHGSGYKFLVFDGADRP